MEDLESLVASALRAFGETGDAPALENAKARYLGKSGALNTYRPSGGTPEERRAAGAAYNAAKERIEQALDQGKTAAPGMRQGRHCRHPIG